MLAFVDESGDPGRRILNGSSQYFVVSVVTFVSPEEATICDQRIDLLRRELGMRPSDEFHFSHNSKRVREAFLEAVASHPFFYYTFALNKNPARLTGRGFDFKDSLYKFAARMACENANLSDATVVLDGAGNREFRHELQAYLRKRLLTPDGNRRIHKVKVQRSSSNNLLQLADYVAGVSNRYISRRRDGIEWRNRYLIRHEASIRIWP